jgi:hypothetical protein
MYLHAFIVAHLLTLSNSVSTEETIWNSIKNDYNKDFRPVKNKSEPLYVTIDSQLAYLLKIVCVLLKLVVIFF